MYTSQTIKAAKHKDIEAFNSLVSEHQDLVYNLAYYVLCDEQAAVRATKQAFIQAFQKLDKYKGGPLQFWFLKNLIEICQQRNNKTTRQLEKPGKPKIPLASLPTELRIILALVEVEGLNYQQVARLIGVSTGKVAQQLSQARQQLSQNYPA
jgi:DNA-directed RNA polymerase specialized sigma24 family protein